MSLPLVIYNCRVTKKSTGRKIQPEEGSRAVSPFGGKNPNLLVKPAPPHYNERTITGPTNRGIPEAQKPQSKVSGGAEITRPN